MKNVQKSLCVAGLMAAPVAALWLTAAIPQISVVLFTLIFLSSGVGAGLSLGLLVILGAAIAPLIFGPKDPPFSAFILVVL
jgi:hypothetical protein